MIDRRCAHPQCGRWFESKGIHHRYCGDHSGTSRHAARTARSDLHQVDFVAIDGEGSGIHGRHEYVLLGIGDDPGGVCEWPTGVRDISDIFTHLYEYFTGRPQATYVGFFLAYDFNMWLRLLPYERAYRLLTAEGKASRIRQLSDVKRTVYWPVQYGDWEFDMLGMKRFMLRPRTPDKGTPSPSMYINDAGPFFQCSLLTAINPKKWPVPIVTESEYQTIVEGKANRATAQLGPEMIRYNLLENDILQRLMTETNTGLLEAGVRLNKRQWFGPGQAAQAWMRQQPDLGRTVAAMQKKKTLWSLARMSYYGGWFELPCHGYVEGESEEDDINSAYPWVAAQIPCVCGRWDRARTSRLPAFTRGDLRLCRVVTHGSNPYLGGLPHRTPDAGILRPQCVNGWYWHHEIDAAIRAGLIDDVDCIEYMEYQGCGHRPPLRGLEGLYEQRMKLGKDTPRGKSNKLIYNSVYGKHAQSLGTPQFAHPVNASLITAGCRTAILEAIATHPRGASDVLMVATDGVYFLSPHPELCRSEQLGEWSTESRRDLTLFKPGVYWDAAARESARHGGVPQFKARGINAADFARSLDHVDDIFRAWTDDTIGWPSVQFSTAFTQVTVLQAIRRSQGKHSEAEREDYYRSCAGVVSSGQVLTQTADASDKRDVTALGFDGRAWHSRPYRTGNRGSADMVADIPPSTPYSENFGMDLADKHEEIPVTPDGDIVTDIAGALGVNGRA